MRQADSVTIISLPSDTTGDLAFITATGIVRSWAHNGGTKEVHFNNGLSNQLLAKNIDAFTLSAYEADGVTPTIVVDDVQMVRCAVQVTLPRGGGQTRTVTCQAWIRSW
jgi:hypothetical protein